MIHEDSLSAQMTKSKARMLLTSQDQELFYKLAFQHYSTDLDKPFDFLEKLMSLHPLPNNISNNFAALLVASNDALVNSLSAQQFCLKVALVLCSAVSLDATRMYPRLPGHLGDIFRGEFGTAGGGTRTNSYEKSVSKAFVLFGEQLSCFLVDEEGRKCVKTRNTHIQHQDSSGTVLKYGGFVSSFADQVQTSWQTEFNTQLQSTDDILEQTQLQSIPTRRLGWCEAERNMDNPPPQYWTTVSDASKFEDIQFLHLLYVSPRNS